MIDAIGDRPGAPEAERRASDPSLDLRHRQARRLVDRSRLALGVVAALVLLNQVLVQPAVLGLATDAPTINVAGRQRMLSQRLVKAALALERAGADSDARDRARAELADVLGLWNTAQTSLSRDRSGRTEPMRAAYEDIEPDFRAMTDAASRIARTGNGPDDELRRRRDLALLLTTEGDYLTRMERIVNLHEQEARARITSLLRFGWLLTGLVLAALAALDRLALRPAARRLLDQLSELRAAREDLEARVRTRTEALEQANTELHREVEKRRQAEERGRALLEQFGHAARTNTLGEMATTLAHELNQPLGAIANYAEGCRVALESPHPPLSDVRTALDRILATTLRAGEVLKRIRRFVTRRGPNREPFDPNALVGEVAELLRHDLDRHAIRLRPDLAPDLPWLEGDPIQVQQVLVNLVRNAIDAILAAQLSNRNVVLTTAPAEEGGVEFRVADQGEGIPPDRLPRIFDAFFSTRAEGMGMGLAISRSIVESHGGRLTVESGPDVGTVFRFTIPTVPIDDGAGTDGLHRR